MSYIDSWKNKKVFEDQLKLNELELEKYPAHWNLFIEAISCITPAPTTLLDIGCGAGVYHELCNRHFPDIEYTGMDYSQGAIDVAKQRWGGERWEVKDYQDLSVEDTLNYDVLHAGAMLDVLPNGDEAFSFLLSLGFKNLIIGRAKLIHENSKSIEYRVYNRIDTYAYSHNVSALLRVCETFDYHPTLTGDSNSCTLLLRKNP